MIFETQIRIHISQITERDSRFHTNFRYKKTKRKTDFRKSNQNRQPFKAKGDSHYHTSFKIKTKKKMKNIEK